MFKQIEKGGGVATSTIVLPGKSAQTAPTEESVDGVGPALLASAVLDKAVRPGGAWSVGYHIAMGRLLFFDADVTAAPGVSFEFAPAGPFFGNWIPWTAAFRHLFTILEDSGRAYRALVALANFHGIRVDAQPGPAYRPTSGAVMDLLLCGCLEVNERFELASQITAAMFGWAPVRDVARAVAVAPVVSAAAPGRTRVFDMEKFSNWRVGCEFGCSRRAFEWVVRALVEHAGANNTLKRLVAQRGAPSLATVRRGIRYLVANDMLRFQSGGRGLRGSVIYNLNEKGLETFGKLV